MRDDCCRPKAEVRLTSLEAVVRPTSSRRVHIIIWRKSHIAVTQYAFADPKRVIAEDTMHSGKETRYFCFGLVGKGVLTVRFTYRSGVIRIFGAGYWRKGKTIYEHENQIHE